MPPCVPRRAPSVRSTPIADRSALIPSDDDAPGCAATGVAMGVSVVDTGALVMVSPASGSNPLPDAPMSRGAPSRAPPLSPWSHASMLSRRLRRRLTVSAPVLGRGRGDWALGASVGRGRTCLHVLLRSTEGRRARLASGLPPLSTACRGPATDALVAVETLDNVEVIAPGTGGWATRGVAAAGAADTAGVA